MEASFVERWHHKARECQPELPPDRLIAYGGSLLPEVCAPCLSFRESEAPARVFDVYSFPEDWTAEERAQLASYTMIGQDGAGNPICVEDPSGTVVLFDHEDWFRTRQFVNSSVGQLAECLLAYMGEHDEARFRSAVLAIDSRAINERSFWSHEAAGLAP